MLLILLTVAFSLNGCQEKEDVVSPEETCDTMAQVQNVAGSGMQLVLENGQVLVPTNAKAMAGTPGNAEFEMNGFKVKEGQQIIIGYNVSDAAATSQGTHVKVVKVNCVVGILPKSGD